MFICLTMEVIYVEFYKGLFCTYGLFFCGKYLMVWIVWWISGFSYPLVGLFRLLSYEELIVWRSCLMTFVMKQNQSLNCAIQQNIVKLFFFLLSLFCSCHVHLTFSIMIQKLAICVVQSMYYMYVVGLNSVFSVE